MLQGGDAGTAERLCRDALNRYPEDANILCLSARALIRLQKFDEARVRLDKTLSLLPEFSRPHEILGELFLAQDKPEKAIEAFRRAIHLNSDSAETCQKLGSVLTMLGRNEEADEIIEESRRRNPIATAIAEAVEFKRSGDLDSAEKIYRKMLLRDPENSEILGHVGALAAAKGQYTDAEIFLQRAVNLAPDYARGWADLVIVQMELEKYDDAVTSAERLVCLDPNGNIARLLLGNACAMSGRHEDALAEYKRFVSRVPGDPGALSGMAHMLKTIGRQEESIAMYRECIRQNPQHTEAWWGLANMKTYRFEDDEIQQMLELLQEGEPKAEPTSRWLTSTPEVNLCNALGMAYEVNCDFDRAFQYIERGNKMRRLDEPYEPLDTERLHDRIIKTFSSGFLEEKSGHGCNDDDAIFIVGLPRTGSTLLEQILSSHKQVEGTHELPELSRISRRLPVVHFERSRYPENVTDLDTNAMAATGQDYIEHTRKYRSGKMLFTDKNLGNFMHIGLLHLILPNARIIDARRHPLDSCLSCYKQLFARGQSFSYDLKELGEYYLQYQGLMDHWDEVLPGKVLHVQYEEVVADLEAQVQRILEHCGLPWDANCLRFHETKRDVRTASSEQVRQPIYNSSVNLWRHYESHLEELIDVLKPLLLKLPQQDQPSVLRNKKIT